MLIPLVKLSGPNSLKLAPKANSEYNIAVDTLGSTTTLHVMKIE